MSKKKKYDPKVNLDMDFDEALGRLSNVPKDKVDKNIKMTSKRRKRGK